MKPKDVAILKKR